jgi:hypothetical protein
MKVVAYSIRDFEKEFLAKTNHKKHDITLISNPLSMETVAYAKGKDAIIVSVNDDVSALVINKLADMGIKYIAAKSININHIDKRVAIARGIKVAYIPAHSLSSIESNGLAGQHLANVVLQEIANQTISYLDLWQQDKCVGEACVGAKDCKENIGTDIINKDYGNRNFGRTY